MSEETLKAFPKEEPVEESMLKPLLLNWIIEFKEGVVKGVVKRAPNGGMGWRRWQVASSINRRQLGRLGDQFADCRITAVTQQTNVFYA